METVVRVCRAACILWHLFFALLLVLFVILVPTQIIRENYLAVALLFTVICGWCYFIFSSYQWYVRCWYEKAIIAQNEQIYGPTIYVSIPVFKLCGHFILVIRDHKYELRLDASTRNRPVFRERPLSLKESEDIRNAFGHNWFVVGWTQRTDDQIKATFTDVIESFGLYHRLRNNCRHFLQSGTMSILDSAATWHEDMLLVGSSLDIAIPKMTLMMWRSMQRDLYRWYWARRYGPGESQQADIPVLPIQVNSHLVDWEALASKQFNDRAMIEDLMDHTFDLSGNSEEAQTFDFKFHERVLDFCCPWIFALICIVVLVTFSIWVNTTEAPSQANMPLSLLIGVYSVSIVVSVILIIYGCCRV
ncbi:hypothetical protein HYDPIDRAFT_27007 [Hydnomerulius pinastri MD-312]|nr:hypothetical protein HYDPIDRAFT_27007 [Hydnomerulius pinastri MD-312]